LIRQQWKKPKHSFPNWNTGTMSYDVAREPMHWSWVTEWNQFRRLDLPRIKDLLKSPIFIDLRNVYDPQQMKRLGFDYCGVGR